MPHRRQFDQTSGAGLLLRQGANGVLHRRFAGSRLQPHRHVVHALVARQALEVPLGDGNRTKLAGIVAPHARYKKIRRICICYFFNSIRGSRWLDHRTESL